MFTTGAHANLVTPPIPRLTISPPSPSEQTISREAGFRYQPCLQRGAARLRSHVGRHTDPVSTTGRYPDTLLYHLKHFLFYLTLRRLQYKQPLPIYTTPSYSTFSSVSYPARELWMDGEGALILAYVRIPIPYFGAL